MFFYVKAIMFFALLHQTTVADEVMKNSEK